MSRWRVDAETLAGSRFVVSPLAETVAALKTLHGGAGSHPGEQRWLATALPRYRERLAADPVTAALVRTALGPRWNATFLTPTPGAAGPTADAAALFARELAEVRATPPAVVRADLAETLGAADESALPSALLGHEDLAGQAAGLLSWVWTETVEPDWARRRRILEADVLARTAALGSGGWAAALDDLRPGMRWLGGDGLRTGAAPAAEARELIAAELLFVPVTPGRSWLCWDVPPVDGRRARPGRRYAVVYPCSGVLVDEGRRPVPKALTALLGAGRAELLTLLDPPKTTSQLVALTGLPLGSVGRHLRILREAGLALRRRAGRSVLYHRTAAGQVLVTAAGSGAQDPGARVHGSTGA
ncbi:transcriptional regulator, ArsR family [Streptomyces sp. TLI_053]|uniref:winged helix-turn-helix domain-containing protein n=1 Tax=Streptomyces sp. TLI_053 TaxID=1855352 RepID=UPI00087B9E67|nr:winged helix-turn-helix domain-containing protein [Streptomyces sp. TLI_053]SDS89842.1 transcriptional regulator, ArsR family [Streptomyces sp. TLI_053]